MMKFRSSKEKFIFWVSFIVDFTVYVEAVELKRDYKFSNIAEVTLVE